MALETGGLEDPGDEESADGALVEEMAHDGDSDGSTRKRPREGPDAIETDHVLVDDDGGSSSSVNKGDRTVSNDENISSSSDERTSSSKGKGQHRSTGKASPSKGSSFFGGGNVDMSSEIVSFGLNFIIILVALFVVNLTTLMLVSDEYGDENSLLPLQSLETQIVYHTQKAMGYNVELETEDNLSMPTILDYPDMEDENGKPAPRLEISGICAGFREMAVISTLVLLVAGVRWSLKVKWALILSGIIFLENLLRIFLIHPMAMEWGYDFAWHQFHTFFWEVGQLLTIMALFILWYLYVAMRDPVRPGFRSSELRFPPKPSRFGKYFRLPRRASSSR